MMKPAPSSFAIEGFVHVVVPTLLTAGVVHVKSEAVPSVGVSDWKVVLDGVWSVKCTFEAASGPALKTQMTDWMLEPAVPRASPGPDLLHCKAAAAPAGS